ncbi:MAG: PHP domain-containing protein [Chloroflexi bacterium]|nr:PHP domain-containing protein [Chloroflexota bacterium]
MAPATLVRLCGERGITCLAVTDHNRIDGALEARAVAPAALRVIVGEEIRTSEGEIIGLFLSEAITRDLSPEETCERIKAQGGLAYVPHPFDRFRRSPIRRAALDRIRDRIDALEVLNARNLWPGHDAAALAFARRWGIAGGAGSDAHTPFEVGNAWVEIEDFTTPREFVAALRRGRVGGHHAGPWVHFITRWVRLRKALADRA